MGQKLHRVFIFVALGLWILASTTSVHAQGVPSPGNGLYNFTNAQCSLFVGTNTLIPFSLDQAPSEIDNKVFLTSGDLISVKYQRSAQKISFDDKDTLLYDMSSTPPNIDMSSNYKLGINYISTDITGGQAHNIYIPLHHEADGSWTEAKGADDNNLGRYIAWLYDTAILADSHPNQDCKFTTDPNVLQRSFKATTSTNSFHIIETGADKKTADWFLVAYRDYTAGKGSQGYIFSNESNPHKYMIVNDAGNITGWFNSNTHEWDDPQATETVSNYGSISINDSSSFTRIDLAPVYADFTDARQPKGSLTVDDVQYGHEMTFVAILYDPFGPYTQKSYNGMNADKTQTSQDGAISGTLYIVTGNNVDNILRNTTESSVKSRYQALLASKLFLCAHKTLQSGSSLSGVISKDLLKPDSTFNSSAFADNGGDNKWKLKETAVITPMTVGTQKCNGAEDIETEGRVGAAVGNVFDAIGKAIIAALAQVALLIQKAIISFAVWLINQVASNVPI